MTMQLDDFTAPEGEVCYTDLVLIMLISALLELLRMLSQWQPARTSQPSTSSAMRLA